MSDNVECLVSVSVSCKQVKKQTHTHKTQVTFWDILKLNFPLG